MGNISIMKDYKLNAILIAIGELIIGLFLIFNPKASKAVICTLLGAALLIYGALSVIAYLKNRGHFWDKARLVLGIIAILISLLFLFKPDSIAAFIGSILGICIIFSACSQILRSLTLKAFHFNQWWTALLIGVIFFLLGLSLVLFPKVYGELLTQFIGAYLAIEAVSDLLTVYRISKLDKNGGHNLFIRY